MAYYEDKQPSLAAKSGVDQKTISNYINPDFARSPTLDNMERIAAAYKIDLWKMLMPDASIKSMTEKEVKDDNLTEIQNKYDSSLSEKKYAVKYILFGEDEITAHIIALIKSFPERNMAIKNEHQDAAIS